MAEYCRKKQSEYQMMGIQGRWQVNPCDLEPPNKKAKTIITTETDVIEKKVKLF